MKSVRLGFLLVALILSSGCDQPTHLPVGGSSNDDLRSWLQTMTKVRVLYSGSTNLHTFLKQGVRDPGNTADNWLPREMEFSNWDSTFTINWQDSQFQTKSCFVFRQINPSYTLSGGCGEQSLIRGTYHAGSNTITNIYCSFQHYDAGVEPNDFQEQDASLIIPELKVSTFVEDSVEFTLQDWKTGSISVGYNYNETAYQTYLREMHLTAYDTTGSQSPNQCRVVFYLK